MSEDEIAYTLRVPRSLHARVRKLAEEGFRSVNMQYIYLLAQAAGWSYLDDLDFAKAAAEPDQGKV